VPSGSSSHPRRKSYSQGGCRNTAAYPKGLTAAGKCSENEFMSAAPVAPAGWAAQNKSQFFRKVHVPDGQAPRKKESMHQTVRQPKQKGQESMPRRTGAPKRSLCTRHGQAPQNKRDKSPSTGRGATGSSPRVHCAATKHKRAPKKQEAYKRAGQKLPADTCLGNHGPSFFPTSPTQTPAIWEWKPRSQEVRDPPPPNTLPMKPHCCYEHLGPP
jgi:hypothetical protein